MVVSQEETPLSVKEHLYLNMSAFNHTGTQLPGCFHILPLFSSHGEEAATG